MISTFQAFNAQETIIQYSLSDPDFVILNVSEPFGEGISTFTRIKKLIHLQEQSFSLPIL